jgi:hypothetical protein
MEAIEMKKEFTVWDRVGEIMGKLSSRYATAEKAATAAAAKAKAASLSGMEFEYFAQVVIKNISKTNPVFAIPDLEINKKWDHIRWWTGTQWTADLSGLMDLIGKELPKFFLKSGDRRPADIKNVGEVRHVINTFYRKPWDQWNTHIAFKNGIWEDGHLRDMKADDFQLRIYHFNLLPMENVKEAEWRPALLQATRDADVVCHYVGGCLRREMSEYFLSFLGSPSSGKSPWLKKISRIIGNENVGRDPLAQLGAIGGLNTWYESCINIDSDADMPYLHKDVFGIVKRIFGDDDEVAVRLLYLGNFRADMLGYMIFATNQLPKIVGGVDSNAIFKRCYCCEFLNTFEDDPAFKLWLDQPELSDQIGSYCFYLPTKSWRLDMGLSNFIHRTQELWNNSAYPIRTILRGLIQRTTDPELYITRAELAMIIADELSGKGIALPINLIAEITESIRLMGGDKCQRGKREAYEGVEWIARETKKIIPKEAPKRKDHPDDHIKRLVPSTYMEK